jgi:transcriptional regulator with XRE-family HTH domain
MVGRIVLELSGYAPMTPKTQKNYLRTHRLRAALSQAELSALLGVAENTLSRYELGYRPIPAEIIIASETIFGVSGAALFPALYNGVEEDLAIRALALHDRLAGRTDARSLKKLALISGIPNRLR